MNYSMATLEYDEQHLARTDYGEKCEVIRQTLEQQSQRLFTLRDQALTFDIDRLAHAVALKYVSSNDYPFENKEGTTYSSVYVATAKEKDDFRHQVELVYEELERQALAALRESSLPCRTLQEYVPRLFQPMDSMHIPRQAFQKNARSGLKYPLGEEFPFEKQQLHISDPQEAKGPWLRGHKASIEVKNIDSFDEQLIDSICTYVEREGGSRDEVDEVRDGLRLEAGKDDSPFALLRKTVIQESLARIQRTAKIQYLRYVYERLRARLNKYPQMQTLDRKTGLRVLHTYIRRLQMIGEYLQREGPAHYQVSFGSARMNFLDLFAQADAFNPLPVMTEFVGGLGEITNGQRGVKTFVNGLKLKLNGPVHNHGGKGQPVFTYNLAFLSPGSQEYETRLAQAGSKHYFYERVVKIALLYYFVFRGLDDPSYNPEADFEREILSVLRSGTDDQKARALRNLHDRLEESVPPLLEHLKQILVLFLDGTQPEPPPPPQTLQVCLNNDALLPDIDSMITHAIYFQETVTANGGKGALRHITINGATANPNSICTLPVSLSFGVMSFFERDEPRERYSMTLRTKGLHVLPVFFAPMEDVQRYAKLFDTSRVVFCYRHRPLVAPDSEQAFMYRFTYQLLAYSFLKIIARQMPHASRRDLFFSLVCLHSDLTSDGQSEGLGEKPAPSEQAMERYDDETFIHGLAEVLAHLLGQDYRASSQGFHINTVLREGKGGFYKLDSALYSLYAALPRRFHLPPSLFATHASPSSHHLQKFAIIVVSSRKCDANYKNPKTFWSSVYGEVIGIERDGEEHVNVQSLSTFTMNQPADRMYEQPAPIVAQVKACYEQGFRHFLYVARAPYTRTLHISDEKKQEDLYFMRREVIQAIRQVGPDVKVYPVFCDKYYVVNLRRKKKQRSLQVDSLYIDDVGELAHVSLDTSRRSLIFLNLFNGAQIDPDRQLYSGVMSYSTLLHIYDNDPAYDQYIWNDLLSSSAEGSLRKEIVDFMTLLHFARYEKPREFGFKLDPFTRIIGDTSVGKAAVFAHMRGRVRFNSLAFLSSVRAVLEREAL